MGRDSTYMPPPTNAEIIQIAAARRAGDAILKQATGRNFVQSSGDLIRALRASGVEAVGIAFIPSRITLARLRIVPPWQRFGRIMSKPEFPDDVRLAVYAGRVFLVDTLNTLEVSFPPELLAMCYDKFDRAGAFNAEGGKMVKTAILKAIGHAVNMRSNVLSVTGLDLPALVNIGAVVRMQEAA